MKKTLSTEKDISAFLIEKIEKAGHHAQDVKYVVPALWGFIQTFGKNPSVKFEEDSPYGNLAWFTMNGIPYCLAYNHNTLMIELRNRSQKGKTIMNFNNNTTNEEIFSIFSVLSVNLEPQSV